MLIIIKKRNRHNFYYWKPRKILHVAIGMHVGTSRSSEIETREG